MSSAGSMLTCAPADSDCPAKSSAWSFTVQSVAAVGTVLTHCICVGGMLLLTSVMSAWPGRSVAGAWRRSDGAKKVSAGPPCVLPYPLYLVCHTSSKDPSQQPAIRVFRSTHSLLLHCPVQPRIAATSAQSSSGEHSCSIRTSETACESASVSCQVSRVCLACPFRTLLLTAFRSCIGHLFSAPWLDRDGVHAAQAAPDSSDHRAACSS